MPFRSPESLTYRFPLASASMSLRNIGGTGNAFGPASTDAVNRAPQTSYGEVTGITQTVRNFGASLGLALLGTILITQNRIHLEDSLTAPSVGLTKAQADQIADSISGGTTGPVGGHAGATASKVAEAIPHDFASASQPVFYGMAVAMALAFVVSLVALPSGRVTEVIPGPEDTPA